MSALDDPKRRKELLILVQMSTPLRPACKMVGTSRTALARYVLANPRFQRQIDEARGKLPMAPKAPAQRPQIVNAEVLDLPARLPTQAQSPTKPGWSQSPASVLARAELMVDDTEAEISLRRTALTYIFAKALRDEQPLELTDQVIVEVVAKDPLPEAADG